MRVTAVRRSVDVQAEAAIGLQDAGDLSRLFELASGADFVISTITLTEQTRGLFDKDLFRAMKPSAFVINVSRGPVIVEDDLLEALRSGEITGAGLDVFAREPLDPASALLGLPNVVATPHIGGVTRQNYDEIARIVADNIARVRDGRAPRFCVNEAALRARGKFFPR